MGLILCNEIPTNYKAYKYIMREINSFIMTKPTRQVSKSNQ